jgi:6-phosphogluconate dehydrogenase
MTDTTAQIGVTGLATMGRNLARNLARHGHTVAVHGVFHVDWSGERRQQAV